ncbi:MAG TPA: diacylglycerol kinase family protein [Gemmataceae bacterium]|nr:diacylglycerol kinase family protein [Gemmataceae bacterium]
MAREMCVIFNPQSGRGRAARRLATLQTQWADKAVFWPTTQPGHAEELASKAAAEGFAVVVAAGGDGTAHEVANGILNARNPNVAFGIVPIGSANDYAHSLQWWHALKQREGDDVDVGVVRDATGRQRYFVCCLGLGFNGMVTLESRKIKRLQGLALYGLATLRALWYHHACPPMEVTIDDQPTAIVPTLMLSILLGRREGGFVLAPDALLDDGLFDYVHADGLSRWEVLKLLPRLAIAGPPKNDPKVRLGRCRRIKLHSPAPLAVHIDGEFFARPEDGVRDLEIWIQPRALKVQMGLTAS